MDEFLILLQAKLDEAKSKEPINSDIDNLQGQINKLKLQAEIDPNAISKLNHDIDKILNKEFAISNIGIDTGKIIKDAKNIGRQVGETISDSAKRSTNNKNINVDKLSADAKALANNLNNFSSRNTGFDEFRIQINGIEVSLDSLISKLSYVDNASDFSTLRSQANALKSAFSELSKINKIQLSIDTGEYNSRVESLISKTRQWTDVNGNARISTNELKSALDNLNSASTTLSNDNSVTNQKRLIAAEKELDVQIKTVTNDIKSMSSNLMKDSAIDNLRQKYQKFYDSNGKSHRQFGAQMKAAMNELSSGTEISIQRGEELEQELIKIQNTCRQTGKLGKTFFQTLREGMSSFSYWTSSTFLVMKAFQSIKSGISTVKELDTALVDLKKTTTMTASELEDFYYASNDVAKQMGVTTEEIINQAAEFSRLGYSSKEAATEMAKYSSWFKTISPGMSIEQAGDTLTSIMKAFKYDVQDVEKIMSMINTVGNNFAVSNLDISEILTRSSSAMMEANNSLADTIALGTAATEITRDAASVGNALKTISMRIRGRQTLPPYTVMYMPCA